MAEHVVGDKYRLEAVVGRGAFGTVYRATHVDLGRRYAVKFLEIPEAFKHDEASVRTRFLREAKILGRLDHPNTVQVIDFGEYRERPYLVTEYLEGKTLRAVRKEEGAFDEPRLHAIALQMLGSLAQAHALGLVHRDLKSTNIMIVRDPTGAEVVKVLDFGVATSFKEDGFAPAADLAVTVAGSFVGTPQYAAPEQFRGEATAASDVYAIGLVMWEMATGGQAVRHKSLAECMHEHVNGDPWKLPPEIKLSSKMRETVERALTREPSERFADATQMLAALEKMSISTTAAAAPEPATQAAPAKDHRLVGKYELGELIGSGGFSRVYKALHVDMRRTVAVKLLDLHGAVASSGNTTAQDLQARFSREARLVSKLQHPNTITVFDFGMDPNGRWYIVMEYVDGSNLHYAVRHEGAFEQRRAARVARDVLRSLSEAHHLGILHRDLKPGNVMLSTDFEGKEIAKVLDFGIATVHDVGAPSDVTKMKATRLGHFVGTPQYAAPEQFLGEPLTPAADIYAVGLVLWEMLCGEAAITDDSFGKCLTHHLNPDPWKLPDDALVSSGLAEILYGALAKTSAERYQAAAEMANDLDEWLSGKRDSFSPPPLTEERWEPALDYESEAFDVRDLDEEDLAVIDPNLDESIPEILRPTAPASSQRERPRPATQPAPERRPAQKEAKLELDFERAGISPGADRVIRPRERTTDHRPPRPPLPTKWIAGGAGALLVAAVAFSMWPEPSDPDAITERDLLSNETMHLEIDPASLKVAEEERPHVNRYTSAGIVKAVRANGWSVRKLSDANSLANVHQQGYKLTKGDTEMEIELVTTKSMAIADQMAAETRHPVRVVVFDNKLVRILPPRRGSSSGADELANWLRTYQKMVLEEGKSPGTLPEGGTPPP